MMAMQSWDPEKYARHAGFVAELGGDVIGMLAPAKGETILDLGCGDGALTEKLLTQGCRVIAIDNSAEQVAAAAARDLDAHAVDGDIVDWLKLFAQSFLADVAEDERDGICRAVRARLVDVLQDDDGNRFVDYMRLRFKAIKPARRDG
jgi:predicted TPR repeat methyltransferase